MRLQRTSLDNFHATARAQRADELARAYVDAVLARTFLSYAHEGVRSRTATKKYYAGLRTLSRTRIFTYTRTSAFSSRTIWLPYERSSPVFTPVTTPTYGRLAGKSKPPYPSKGRRCPER